MKFQDVVMENSSFRKLNSGEKNSIIILKKTANKPHPVFDESKKSTITKMQEAVSLAFHEKEKVQIMGTFK